MLVHLPSCRTSRRRLASGQARPELVVLGTPGASQPPSSRTEDRRCRPGGGVTGNCPGANDDLSHPPERRVASMQRPVVVGTPPGVGTTLESAGCGTYPRHMHLDVLRGLMGG